MKSYLNVVIATLLLCLSGLALADRETDQGASQDGMATAELGLESMNAEETITVNVNEADAQTLADVLKGVGVKRAQAIVDYREEHGKFFTPEELTAVRGIGKSTVKRNRARIALK